MPSEVPRLVTAVDSDAAVEPAARELAALGIGALPQLLEQLEDEELSEPRRMACLLAMARLPPRSVRLFCSERARNAAPETREALLSILGTIGEPGDLALLVDIGAPARNEGAGGEHMAHALRNAFERVLRRRPPPEEVVRALLRCEPGPRWNLAEAVVKAETPESFGILVELLGFEHELDPRILDKLWSTARTLEQLPEERVLERVREYLERGEPLEIVGAVRALAHAGDPGAIPFLVPLLEHEDEAVLRATEEALRQLTGLGLGPGRARWEHWLREELAWREQRLPGVLRRLSTPDALVVAAALREVALHRLGRDELAAHVAEVLEHRDPRLRELACETLRQLGARPVAQRVRLLLEDDAPAVRSAAERCLQTLAPALPPRPGFPRPSHASYSARP
jgi:HEAT repeat protein